MAEGATLRELIALAHEPSSARRRELLRRVTDLFLEEGDAHPPGASAAFDDVMCGLAASMEGDIRAELSLRFADAPAAPSALAARLARDCIEVALPILSNANLLDESDLIDIARTQGQDHLRVVSARPDLTEAVSDVIVERGDDQTLGVLVRNDAAPLSRRASETVAARAEANPELQAVVVGRADMPLDLVNEMYFVVETKLREHILARNAKADPAALDAALKAARGRLAARQDVDAETLSAAATDVAKAAARRRLDGPAILDHLRSGRRSHFAAGLAHLAGVEPGTVLRVADRADIDALAIVCKAASLDRALYVTFAVLLQDGRDAMAKAPEWGRLYGELPKDAAERTLRFWRIRCETEQIAA